MPQQELFFERKIGERLIEVNKTYDRNFAREAFEKMGEQAQSRLWQSLGIEGSYAPEDIPDASDPNRTDFLWEELLDAAREDGSVLSFFVVTEGNGNGSESLYVRSEERRVGKSVD